MLAHKIIMVKPSAFHFNVETAKDNVYQNDDIPLSDDAINDKAQTEFLNFVDRLRDVGVEVDIVEDLGDDTPDSIFPNNTFVTFPGKLFLCPMYSDNRQREFAKLKSQYDEIMHFAELEVVDFREKDGVLEGTGAMVIDRHENICYGALSKRCDQELFLDFCKLYDLIPVPFRAHHHDLPVYHTNVIMTVAEHFALIADDLITEGREDVLKHLEDSGKTLISLSADQIDHFAGNCLELMGVRPVLVMSEEAYKSLNNEQIEAIEAFDEILAVPLPVISTLGGGSARCMIAENFLDC